MSILAVGCSGSSQQTATTDGDAAATAFQLKVANVPSATNALTDGEASQMTISSGAACVSEIRLQAPDGVSCADIGFVARDGVSCEEESEMEDGQTVIESKIKVAGPIMFDLLTGSSTPSLADLDIPSGVYRKIEFRFDKDCNDPEGNIQIEGSVTDSSDVDHAYAIDLKYDDDFEIESDDDVQVVEGDTNELFATLFLNQWFSNIDLVGCIDNGNLVPDGSGIIQINESTDASGSCENIYEDVLEGIKDGFEFEGEHHENDDSTDDNDSTLVK